MEQTFDFEKIGKQMPYTVPDGFFDTLEENVMKRREASVSKGKARTVRLAIRTALAVAACLALFFIVRSTLQHDGDAAADDFENVELAFSNLSTEDQDYLLENFQDDLFMNNNDIN